MSAIAFQAAPSESVERRWRITFLVSFLLALLARIPFYATHHIQEDAYITFRSAFNLADLHDYSFNLGDHATGVTSALYGPYVAAIRLLFRSHAITAVSLLNTAIFLAGATFLAFAFFNKWRHRLLFFIAIALLPVGLLISYTGMEIPLQVAAFCCVIFPLRRGQPNRFTLIGILLLPLIRPDAIAYSLILSVLVYSFDKVRGILAVIFSFAGSALVLIFNRLLTGQFITATMQAKEAAYRPHHGIFPFLAAARTILITYSYLQPVETKFLDWAGPLATLIVLAGCILALRILRKDTVVFRLVLACFAAGVLIPAAYAFGGVLFPWYFWTSNWLCLSLICFVVVKWVATLNPQARAATLVVLALIWVGMDGLQWLVSCNIGLQEYHYRADVGRWLHQTANPADTLELEPSGYIPFYAGLRTYDEIGLVSPLVLDYRIRYGGAWWMAFLKQKRPDWLVERVNAPEHITMDGVHLSPQDANWFDAHYTLVRHFHYSPENYVHNPFLLDLMKNGTHADYYVYRSTTAR